MGNPNHDQRGRFSSGGGSGGSNKRGHMGKLDTGAMTPAMQRMTGTAHVDSNGRPLQVGDRAHDNLAGVDGRVTTKHFEGGNGKPLVTIKTDQGVSITRSPQDVSSGAAVGDHLAEAGPRNAAPVTRHAGAPSVGTEAGSGGRLSEAARANIIRGKGIDQRHYGVTPSATMGLKTTLQGGARTSKLNPATHDTPATRRYLASIKKH